MTAYIQVDEIPEDIREIRAGIEKETGKTPEQLYEEREQRVRDAINLKESDRVPLWIIPEPHKVYGLSHAIEYYEPVAWKKALRNIILDFEPDLALPGFGTSGSSLEALDVKNKLWPGGPLPPDYEYQFVEGEYMKEDEYDMFLGDPSDFIIRRLLPRVYGVLEPLAELPPVSGMFSGFEYITTMFTNPEFEAMAKAISRAGKELQKYRDVIGNTEEELALLGFPPFSQMGGAGGAPFDTLSSFFRGMEGSMIDMFRRPEKLLQACDLILEMRIKNAKPADPTRRGNPKRLGLPLWRGDKSFMSEAQFNKFYWPGLKKALAANIELGYVPLPFFEAPFGERLERLRELPRTKVVALIDHADAVPAKKMLGDHNCIIVTAPHSLEYAPPQKSIDFYKNIMDQCATGGGLMLSINLPNNSTREELKAMIEEIREYSKY